MQNALILDFKNIYTKLSFRQPDKNTYIQIWKNTTFVDGHKPWQEYLFNITRDGYKAILSSPWYINFIKYGYKEWYDFYAVDPLNDFNGSDEQAKLIIGGEACLWSEYVDGTNIGNLTSQVKKLEY